MLVATLLLQTALGGPKRLVSTRSADMGHCIVINAATLLARFNRELRRDREHSCVIWQFSHNVWLWCTTQTDRMEDDPPSGLWIFRGKICAGSVQKSRRHPSCREGGRARAGACRSGLRRRRPIGPAKARLRVPAVAAINLLRAAERCAGIPAAQPRGSRFAALQAAARSTADAARSMVGPSPASRRPNRGRWVRRPLLFVIDPDTALICGADAVLDPAHAFNPRPDVGIAQGREPLGLSPVGRVHGDGETGVKVGPGLEQALGMARPDAVRRPGLRDGDSPSRAPGCAPARPGPQRKAGSAARPTTRCWPWRRRCAASGYAGVSSGYG